MYPTSLQPPRAISHVSHALAMQFLLTSLCVYEVMHVCLGVLVEECKHLHGRVHVWRLKNYLSSQSVLGSHCLELGPLVFSCTTRELCTRDPYVCLHQSQEGSDYRAGITWALALTQGPRLYPLSQLPATFNNNVSLYNTQLYSSSCLHPAPCTLHPAPRRTNSWPP